MNCPSCGNRTEPQWKRCPECGAPLRQAARDIAAARVPPEVPQVLRDCYEHSWALIIGINDYQCVEKLDYAVPDAQEVRDALLTLGFDEQYIITLLNDQASRESIHEAMNRTMVEETGENDRLLVFFAGHGKEYKAKGRRGHTLGYLLPVDAQPKHIPHTAISMEDLGKWNDLIPAKHILYVLDCCYSGLATRRAAARLDPEHYDYVAQVTARPARQVITAGRGDQVAYEKDGHGLFTELFIRGIQGDADIHGRGYVTAFALADYLKDRVFARSKGKQEPLFRYLDDSDGEFLFIPPRPEPPPSPPSRDPLDHFVEPEPIPLSSTGPAVLPTTPPTLPSARPGAGRIELVEQPALHIESSPPGAAVSVDGTPVGQAPLRLTLKAGEYRIRAEKEGYQPWEQRLRYDRVGDASLRIELKQHPRIVEAFFPMTPDQAREVQQAAARALGKPPAEELDLGNGVKVKLALIPAGKLLMGAPKNEEGRCDDEGPQHEVRITRPFYMGVFPVTQRQWRQVTGDNPSYFRDERGTTQGFPGIGHQTEKVDRPDYPVEQVSWDDATAFCVALIRRAGRIVRLPTEAEWEYACRAGSPTRFSFGDDGAALALHGWFEGNSGSQTHTVGHKRPNAWALYDMHGNVWEWCSDWFGPYASAQAVDPKGQPLGAARVLRGGSWDLNPRHCRSAYRFRISPEIRSYYIGVIGFRVVVDLVS